MRRIVASLLVLVACNASDETSGDTTPTPTVECPDGSWEVLMLQLLPEDEDAECLRTEPEERVTVPFCVDPSKPRAFHCVRDEAGREFLVRASESIIPPSGYSLCEGTDGVFYTRPCHTECDEPTLGTPWLESYCGEEETRVAGNCGAPDYPYDENCCRRPFCFDGTCPAGMSCEWLLHDDMFVAINPQTGQCGAWGQVSPPEPHCVPISSP